MAHTEEIMIHGVMTPVTVVDSSAQDIDDAVNKTKFYANPNLLDNGYFGNPVDQRGGYVVPPGVEYYTGYNTGSPVAAGTTEQYYTVLSNDGSWATINIGGITYGVPAIVAVRGYTGVGYTIDRWRTDKNNAVTVENNYICFNNNGEAYTEASQAIDTNIHKALVGKTVTATILYADNTLYTGSSVLAENCDVNFFSCDRLRINAYFTNNFKRIRLLGDASTTVKGAIVAVKLELGSVQTLAHLENGKWVLNEIPNYAEELAKCQRYFRRFDLIRGATIATTPFIPVFATYPDMRIAPAVTVKGRIADGGDSTIDGVSVVNSVFYKNAASNIQISEARTGDVLFYDVWLDAGL